MIGEQKVFVVPANATLETIAVTDSVFGANTISIYAWPEGRITIHGRPYVQVSSSRPNDYAVSGMIPGWRIR